MESRIEKQKNISNKDVDWAKHYDLYEVEFRDYYRTVSKPQNDSHFEMLKVRAKKYLRKDKVFAEIGFSAGLTLRYAFKYFGKVYGLDISSKNVELTRKELLDEGYHDFELYVSDLMVFDKRLENKFDVISYIHGLEHFSKEDTPRIFENVKKYLKSSGIFTGALPYNKAFTFIMCPNCNSVFEKDGHVSIYDIDSLKNVFDRNGFEVIHLQNYNLKYSLRNKGILKKLYIYLSYYLSGNKPNGQIEFIVKPMK